MRALAVILIACFAFVPAEAKTHPTRVRIAKISKKNKVKIRKAPKQHGPKRRRAN